MRTQKLSFSGRQEAVLCVFPGNRSELQEAISILQLKDHHPVIVLIGGAIKDDQAEITHGAIENLADIAEQMNAVVICGGTDLGVMSEIGLVHSKKNYQFPLIGIAPEALVTWPGGPRSTKFLWWGVKRWQLESHYTHFVLVPGDHFGDESTWINDAGTILSKGSKSVTVLVNGGEISKKDVELSLKKNRPVIALSHTGRYADELAGLYDRNRLITIVSANARQRLEDALKETLILT